jgi:hypothetical protein
VKLVSGAYLITLLRYRVHNQHNQRRHVTMGYSALGAKKPLLNLLGRNVGLQSLHNLNMMGSTYSEVRALMRKLDRT